MVYVVEKDERGQPEALYRFNVAEATAEYLTTEGVWLNDAGLWGILDDLHNPFYEQITATQAQQVARVCLANDKQVRKSFPA
jgi:hypothetical protein